MCRHPLAAVANTVIGIDVSDEMLGARGSESAAEFVIARAERMPFPDATFDLARPRGDRGASTRTPAGAALAIYTVRFWAKWLASGNSTSGMSTTALYGIRPLRGNEYAPANLRSPVSNPPGTRTGGAP